MRLRGLCVQVCQLTDLNVDIYGSEMTETIFEPRRS